MQALSKPTDKQLIEPNSIHTSQLDDIRQAILGKILF